MENLIERWNMKLIVFLVPSTHFLDGLGMLLSPGSSRPQASLLCCDTTLDDGITHFIFLAEVYQQHQLVFQNRPSEWKQRGTLCWNLIRASKHQPERKKALETIILYIFRDFLSWDFCADVRINRQSSSFLFIRRSYFCLIGNEQMKG